VAGATAANQEVTAFLSPSTSVRLVWAMTGGSTKETESKEIAVLAKRELDDAIAKGKEGGEAERAYVRGATAAIYAAMRSLDTIYKGRQLNFDENEELRSEILKGYTESSQFGQKAGDLLKSIPSMAVASGAGTVTLTQVFDLPGWAVLSLGLGTAGLGFFINMLVVRSFAYRKQLNYICQDHERNKYYQQYIDRVRLTLFSLYMDTDDLHKEFFGAAYSVVKKEDPRQVVENVLKGDLPTECQYVDKCLRLGRIKADQWAICETWGERTEKCPHQP